MFNNWLGVSCNQLWGSGVLETSRMRSTQHLQTITIQVTEDKFLLLSLFHLQYKLHDFRMSLNICTVRGLSISELPVGGSGVKPTGNVEAKDESHGSADLRQLITQILSEAIPFIDGVAPKAGGEPTWKSRGSPKKFPDSDAPVYQYERTVLVKGQKSMNESVEERKQDQRNNTWFCRKSCHKNSAEKGTASWEEFVRGFKDSHAETEKNYISTVIAVRKAMSWDTKSLEIEIEGGKWIDISLELWEMKHQIDPKPLKNRTFPPLHITARLAGTNEFIVVQLPVSDIDRSPYAEYARDKSLVVAAYTSIERIRILPESGEIEWIMATASDVGGVLPQWMQNLAVPGEITKDVQKFLAWIPSQRTS